MHDDWKGHAVRLSDGRRAIIVRQDVETSMVTLRLDDGETIEILPGEFDLFDE